MRDVDFDVKKRGLIAWSVQNLPAAFTRLAGSEVTVRDIDAEFTSKGDPRACARIYFTAAQPLSKALKDSLVYSSNVESAVPAVKDVLQQGEWIVFASPLRSERGIDATILIE